MVINSIRISVACFLVVLFAPSFINAQDKAASTKESEKGVETLRKKLDEQEAQVNQLQQRLQQQSDLIQRQQRLLEDLQQKVERASAPTLVHAAAKSATVAEVSATEEKAIAKATPKPAQSVETGYGKIRFNGLVQGWFAAGDGGFADTFRLRHADLKFTGEITPEAKWTVILDLAKALSVNKSFTTINGTRVLTDASVNQGSRIFQEAFITLGYLKNANVDIGQVKLPLGLEGTQPSGNLETVERALFISDGARGGGFGDVNDTGVMVRGPLTKHFDYQVGVFNGSGESQNDVDNTDSKAVIGRVVARPPFIKGLQVGGSGAWGNGKAIGRPRRDRLGAELLYSHRAFMFKSELMTGKDADIHRIGYYTHFGYRVRPKLEAIFRFDAFDPDRRLETNSANVTERDYIAGFNYYITENNLKLQFNYLRKTFADQIRPSSNLVLVNMQTSW